MSNLDKTEDALVFHAGTKAANGEIVTEWWTCDCIYSISRHDG